MTANITTTTVSSGDSGKTSSISTMIGQLDAAMSENKSCDLTSGNVSLLAADLKGNQVFIAKNATTSGRTVTFSAPSKRFIMLMVDSSCTHSVEFIVGSGNITINPSKKQIVYLDGTTNGLVAANQESLADLSDVDVTTVAPTDEQFLRFDASTSKWRPFSWNVTTQTGSYTFVLADAGSTVQYNSGSAGTFTLPPNSSVAFPIGAAIECIQKSTGLLTIAGGAGVTVHGDSLVTINQYDRMLLRKIATNEWNVALIEAGTGGGGGALSTLSDVTLSSPANNDALLYETSSSKWKNKPVIESIIVAVGDETTVITTGSTKITFRMPYAFTLSSVRASLTTASSSGLPNIDLKMNGTSVFSTTLTIDATEKTSTTAATAAVLSTTALTDDAEMTIDINTAGTNAAGLKVCLLGSRT